MSLSGLDSITYYQRLSIELENTTDLTALNQIDTIERFRFFFNDSIKNLDFLENIKLIWTLYIFGNGDLSNINNKIKKFNNILPLVGISGNALNLTFNNLIDPSLDSLYSLSIYNCQNLNLNGFENIKFINTVSIRQCKSFSYNGLEKLETIYSLEIEGNDFTQMDTIDGFDALKQVNILLLENNEGLTSLNQFGTSDLSVNSYLSIKNNPDLVSVSPLEWMDIPRDIHLNPNVPEDIHIDISDNPLLEDCESFLLCKALETYPDSVIITNNGGNCNVDYLLENCDLVLSNNDVIKNNIVIYPNPFNDYFTISSDVIIDEVELYNTSGVKLDITKFGSHNYYCSRITNGIYHLKIKSGNHIYYQRLVNLMR